MKSSPHFPRKIKQKSRQNSSFSIQWNGQAPRETNQFEQNTGTKIPLSSKISLKFALGRRQAYPGARGWGQWWGTTPPSSTSP